PTAAAAEALRFARRHYGAALLLWVPALVVDVAGELALDAYDASHPAPVGLSASLSYLGVALPVLLLISALNLALFAPTGALVLDRARGGRSALAAIVRSPLSLLALGLVLTLLYAGGALLALVGAVVFYHSHQFVPVALADRRRGLGDAFEASRRFARERRVLGFTALSVFAMLVAFVAQAALTIGGLALLTRLGLDGAWAGALVRWVPVWLVMPFLAILPAAYWALAERAPPAEPSPQPSPAAERFRTTKCPRCGTLIPYEATGAPVDVACPSCGRRGRVL
ncbi:MAG: hypothetical protein QOE90_1341, partial [Thermoplasmata archaeon]|nr:hypothetical protein [Thermoplasmata archaeon]